MEKPLVAKRDITVLKYLQEQHGSYKTPCQNTPVTLNKVLEASESQADIHYSLKDNWGNSVYKLNGGAIHAQLSENNNYGNCCKLAIIPKGTEYRIDPFGLEVAAKKMFITDKDGSNATMDISFWEEVLENAPSLGDIHVGDYMTEDDSFVHPHRDISKDRIRGIVVGFHEGQPIIAALSMLQALFDTSWNFKIGDFTSYTDDAIRLFNGRQVTQMYREKYAGNPDNAKRLKAFDACINYRKDKEDEEWYYGAFGEVTTMLNNALYINAAFHITGLGFEITTVGWYSSCSEYSSSRSWGCSLFSCRVCCDWLYKYDCFRVVPFFAWEKKIK